MNSNQFVSVCSMNNCGMAHFVCLYVDVAADRFRFLLCQRHRTNWLRIKIEKYAMETWVNGVVFFFFYVSFALLMLMPG